MTDEELDLLASSLLDGEATHEEVAMVERDPALLARVEELRMAQTAVRTPVPQPPMQLKQDQLGAALAAFDAADRRTTVLAVDEPTADPAFDVDGDHSDSGHSDSGSVIDLRGRRERRQMREADAAGRMRWLSAVAGVLVFTAGAVFLIGQVGGGDDGEFAGDVVSDATEAAESVEVQASPAANADADTADTTALADEATEGDDAAIASESMEADAEEDFAEDGEEAAADEEAAGESTDDAGTADAGPIIRDDLPDEGFFGDEPVASFATTPTSDELLAELDLPWRNPDSANCADRAALPDGAEVIAYLPIEVPAAGGSGEPASRVVEALFLTIGNESLVILVDPETCDLA